MIGRLDSPNNKYYIQKNTLAALLNTLYSVKPHFKMINYSEILKCYLVLILRSQLKKGLNLVMISQNYAKKNLKKPIRF